MTLEEKIFYIRLDAKEEGRAEGKAEAILDLLGEYGSVPENIVEKIKAEADIDQLKKWLKLAAKVDSMQGFIDNM